MNINLDYLVNSIHQKLENRKSKKLNVSKDELRKFINSLLNND